MWYVIGWTIVTLWLLSKLGVFKSSGKEENEGDVRRVAISMGIRKYLYRQAWIFNIIWFFAYLILMFTVGRQQPQAMPDLIWQG